MLSLDESWKDFFADRQARKDADKIAKRFQKEAEEQIKMTREEAVKKLKDVNISWSSITSILDAFEVLGLIKFEEENIDDIIICITTVNIKNEAVYARFGDLKLALSVIGFKVIKS